MRNALDGPSGSTIVDERPLREPAGNENTVQESIQQAQGDSNVPAKDPLIYPGVYSPSGIDMLSILVCLSPVVSIAPCAGFFSFMSGIYGGFRRCGLGLSIP